MKFIGIKILKRLGLFDTKEICYGIEIPSWCIGDAVNSWKYDISEKQQKKVRDWYLKHMKDYCEKITDYSSNWIGSNFGTQYYSASSQKWNGFRLCVGNNIYVKLY